MKGILSKLTFTRKCLFVFALSLPVYATAAEDYISELSNDSKTGASDGYSLVQDKVWAENGCILESGKDKLNPGDMTTLKIKKDCKWGVVRYKITKVKGGDSMGFLAHSFHDGVFSLEITADCNGNKCVFRDLSPEQFKS